MALRLVFFGTPEFAETVLEGLLDSPHEVAAAVTAPDRPSGRGRKTRPGPVSRLARERGIALLQPEKLRDEATIEELRRLGADCFAVASYGLILPREALDTPRLCALNAHASVLPALRGAAPVERAILEGHAETGVSVQRMVRRVDAGPVYAVERTRIGPDETAGELKARLARIAAGLLPRVLSEIESGAAEPRLQDDSRATYAPPLRPEERAVSWSEAAPAISRRVRAFAPRPGAFARLPEELGGGRLKLLAAKAVQATAGPPGEVVGASGRDGIVVSTGEGALELVTVQPEGKRPMPAAAFVRGRAVRAGMRFRNGLEG
jgi:methionyl-tRNA formyltransferase